MKITKKLLAGGIVGASLLGGVAAAVPSGAASTGSASGTNPAAVRRCDTNRDDQWPAQVDGRPAGLDAGDAGGVYLWHDRDGWHLRVTHRGDDRGVLSGMIWTGGTISKPVPVKLEKDDKVVVGPHDHALLFRFVNYGGIDGVDFTTHCADALHITLRADGRLLPASRVYVGHDADHPSHDPFVVHRTGDRALSA